MISSLPLSPRGTRWWKYLLRSRGYVESVNHHHLPSPLDRISSIRIRTSTKNHHHHAVHSYSHALESSSIKFNAIPSSCGTTRSITPRTTGATVSSASSCRSSISTMREKKKEEKKKKDGDGSFFSSSCWTTRRFTGGCFPYVPLVFFAALPSSFSFSPLFLHSSRRHFSGWVQHLIKPSNPNFPILPLSLPVLLLPRPPSLPPLLAAPSPSPSSSSSGPFAFPLFLPSSIEDSCRWHFIFLMLQQYGRVHGIKIVMEDDEERRLNSSSSSSSSSRKDVRPGGREVRHSCPFPPPSLHHPQQHHFHCYRERREEKKNATDNDSSSPTCLKTISIVFQWTPANEEANCSNSSTNNKTREGEVEGGRRRWGRRRVTSKNGHEFPVERVNVFLPLPSFSFVPSSTSSACFSSSFFVSQKLMLLHLLLIRGNGGEDPHYYDRNPPPPPHHTKKMNNADYDLANEGDNALVGQEQNRVENVHSGGRHPYVSLRGEGESEMTMKSTRSCMEPRQGARFPSSNFSSSLSLRIKLYDSSNAVWNRAYTATHHRLLTQMRAEWKSHPLNYANTFSSSSPESNFLRQAEEIWCLLFLYSTSATGRAQWHGYCRKHNKKGGKIGVEEDEKRRSNGTITDGDCNHPSCNHYDNHDHNNHARISILTVGIAGEHCPSSSSSSSFSSSSPPRHVETGLIARLLIPFRDGCRIDGKDGEARGVGVLSSSSSSSSAFSSFGSIPPCVSRGRKGKKNEEKEEEEERRMALGAAPRATTAAIIKRKLMTTREGISFGIPLFSKEEEEWENEKKANHYHVSIYDQRRGMMVENTTTSTTTTTATTTTNKTHNNNYNNQNQMNTKEDFMMLSPLLFSSSSYYSAESKMDGWWAMEWLEEIIERTNGKSTNEERGRVIKRVDPSENHMMRRRRSEEERDNNHPNMRSDGNGSHRRTREACGVMKRACDILFLLDEILCFGECRRSRHSPHSRHLTPSSHRENPLEDISPPLSYCCSLPLLIYGKYVYSYTFSSSSSFSSSSAFSSSPFRVSLHDSPLPSPLQPQEGNDHLPHCVMEEMEARSGQGRREDEKTITKNEPNKAERRKEKEERNFPLFSSPRRYRSSSSSSRMPPSLTPSSSRLWSFLLYQHVKEREDLFYPRHHEEVEGEERGETMKRSTHTHPPPPRPSSPPSSASASSSMRTAMLSRWIRSSGDEFCSLPPSFLYISKNTSFSPFSSLARLFPNAEEIQKEEEKGKTSGDNGWRGRWEWGGGGGKSRHGRNVSIFDPYWIYVFHIYECFLIESVAVTSAAAVLAVDSAEEGNGAASPLFSPFMKNIVYHATGVLLVLQRLIGAVSGPIHLTPTTSSLSSSSSSFPSSFSPSFRGVAARGGGGSSATPIHSGGGEISPRPANIFRLQPLLELQAQFSGGGLGDEREVEHTTSTTSSSCMSWSSYWRRCLLEGREGGLMLSLWSYNRRKGKNPSSSSSSSFRMKKMRRASSSPPSPPFQDLAALWREVVRTDCLFLISIGHGSEKAEDLRKWVRTTMTAAGEGGEGGGGGNDISSSLAAVKMDACWCGEKSFTQVCQLFSTVRHHVEVLERVQLISSSTPPTTSSSFFSRGKVNEEDSEQNILKSKAKRKKEKEEKGEEEEELILFLATYLSCGVIQTLLSRAKEALRVSMKFFLVWASSSSLLSSSSSSTTTTPSSCALEVGMRFFQHRIRNFLSTQLTLHSPSSSSSFFSPLCPPPPPLPPPYPPFCSTSWTPSPITTRVPSSPTSPPIPPPSTDDFLLLSPIRAALPVYLRESVDVSLLFGALGWWTWSLICCEALMAKTLLPPPASKETKKEHLWRGGKSGRGEKMGAMTEEEEGGPTHSRPPPLHDYQNRTTNKRKVGGREKEEEHNNPLVVQAVHRVLHSVLFRQHLSRSIREAGRELFLDLQEEWKRERMVPKQIMREEESALSPSDSSISGCSSSSSSFFSSPISFWLFCWREFLRKRILACDGMLPPPVVVHLALEGALKSGVRADSLLHKEEEKRKRKEEAQKEEDDAFIRKWKKADMEKDTKASVLGKREGGDGGEAERMENLEEEDYSQCGSVHSSSSLFGSPSLPWAALLLSQYTHPPEELMTAFPSSSSSSAAATAPRREREMPNKRGEQTGEKKQQEARMLEETKEQEEVRRKVDVPHDVNNRGAQHRACRLPTREEEVAKKEARSSLPGKKIHLVGSLPSPQSSPPPLLYKTALLVLHDVSNQAILPFSSSPLFSSPSSSTTATTTITTVSSTSPFLLSLEHSAASMSMFLSFWSSLMWKYPLLSSLLWKSIIEHWMWRMDRARIPTENENKEGTSGKEVGGQEKEKEKSSTCTFRASWSTNTNWSAIPPVFRLPFKGMEWRRHMKKRLFQEQYKVSRRISTSEKKEQIIAPSQHFPPSHYCDRYDYYAMYSIQHYWGEMLIQFLSLLYQQTAVGATSENTSFSIFSSSTLRLSGRWLWNSFLVPMREEGVGEAAYESRKGRNERGTVKEEEIGWESSSFSFSASLSPLFSVLPTSLRDRLEELLRRHKVRGTVGGGERGTTIVTRRKTEKSKEEMNGKESEAQGMKWKRKAEEDKQVLARIKEVKEKDDDDSTRSTPSSALPFTWNHSNHDRYPRQNSSSSLPSSPEGFFSPASSLWYSVKWRSIIMALRGNDGGWVGNPRTPLLLSPLPPPSSSSCSSPPSSSYSLTKEDGAHRLFSSLLKEAQGVETWLKERERVRQEEEEFSFFLQQRAGDGAIPPENEEKRKGEKEEREMGQEEQENVTEEEEEGGKGAEEERRKKKPHKKSTCSPVFPLLPQTLWVLRYDPANIITTRSTATTTMTNSSSSTASPSTSHTRMRKEEKEKNLLASTSVPSAKASSDVSSSAPPQKVEEKETEEEYAREPMGEEEEVEVKQIAFIRLVKSVQFLFEEYPWKEEHYPHHPTRPTTPPAAAATLDSDDDHTSIALTSLSCDVPARRHRPWRCPYCLYWNAGRIPSSNRTTLVQQQQERQKSRAKCAKCAKCGSEKGGWLWCRSCLQLSPLPRTFAEWQRIALTQLLLLREEVWHEELLHLHLPSSIATTKTTTSPKTTMRRGRIGSEAMTKTSSVPPRGGREGEEKSSRTSRRNTSRKSTSFGIIHEGLSIFCWCCEAELCRVQPTNLGKGEDKDEEERSVIMNMKKSTDRKNEEVEEDVKSETEGSATTTPMMLRRRRRIFTARTEDTNLVGSTSSTVDKIREKEGQEEKIQLLDDVEQNKRRTRMRSEAGGGGEENWSANATSPLYPVHTTEDEVQEELYSTSSSSLLLSEVGDGVYLSVNKSQVGRLWWWKAWRCPTCHDVQYPTPLPTTSASISLSYSFAEEHGAPPPLHSSCTRWNRDDCIRTAEEQEDDNLSSLPSCTCTICGAFPSLPSEAASLLLQYYCRRHEQQSHHRKNSHCHHHSPAFPPPSSSSFSLLLRMNSPLLLLPFEAVHLHATTPGNIFASVGSGREKRQPPPPQEEEEMQKHVEEEGEQDESNTRRKRPFPLFPPSVLSTVKEMLSKRHLKCTVCGMCPPGSGGGKNDASARFFPPPLPRPFCVFCGALQLPWCCPPSSSSSLPPSSLTSYKKGEECDQNENERERNVTLAGDWHPSSSLSHSSFSSSPVKLAGTLWSCVGCGSKNVWYLSACEVCGASLLHTLIQRRWWTQHVYPHVEGGGGTSSSSAVVWIEKSRGAWRSEKSDAEAEEQVEEEGAATTPSSSSSGGGCCMRFSHCCSFCGKTLQLLQRRCWYCGVPHSKGGGGERLLLPPCSSSSFLSSLRALDEKRKGTRNIITTATTRKNGKDGGGGDVYPQAWKLFPLPLPSMVKGRDGSGEIVVPGVYAGPAPPPMMALQHISLNHDHSIKEEFEGGISAMRFSTHHLHHYHHHNNNHISSGGSSTFPDLRSTIPSASFPPLRVLMNCSAWMIPLHVGDLAGRRRRNGEENAKEEGEAENDEEKDEDDLKNKPVEAHEEEQQEKRRRRAWIRDWGTIRKAVLMKEWKWWECWGGGGEKEGRGISPTILLITPTTTTTTTTTKTRNSSTTSLCSPLPSTSQEEEEVNDYSMKGSKKSSTALALLSSSSLIRISSSSLIDHILPLVMRHHHPHHHGHCYPNHTGNKKKENTRGALLFLFPPSCGGVPAITQESILLENMTQACLEKAPSRNHKASSSFSSASLSSSSSWRSSVFLFSLLSCGTSTMANYPPPRRSSSSPSFLFSSLLSSFSSSSSCFHFQLFGLEGIRVMNQQLLHLITISSSSSLRNLEREEKNEQEGLFFTLMEEILWWGQVFTHPLWANVIGGFPWMKRSASRHQHQHLDFSDEEEGEDDDEEEKIVRKLMEKGKGDTTSLGEHIDRNHHHHKNNYHNEAERSSCLSSSWGLAKNMLDTMIDMLILLRHWEGIKERKRRGSEKKNTEKMTDQEPIDRQNTDWHEGKLLLVGNLGSETSSPFSFSSSSSRFKEKGQQQYTTDGNLVYRHETGEKVRTNFSSSFFLVRLHWMGLTLSWLELLRTSSPSLLDDVGFHTLSRLAVEVYYYYHQPPALTPFSLFGSHSSMFSGEPEEEEEEEEEGQKRKRRNAKKRRKWQKKHEENAKIPVIQEEEGIGEKISSASSYATTSLHHQPQHASFLTRKKYIETLRHRYLLTFHLSAEEMLATAAASACARPRLIYPPRHPPSPGGRTRRSSNKSSPLPPPPSAVLVKRMTRDQSEEEGTIMKREVVVAAAKAEATRRRAAATTTTTIPTTTSSSSSSSSTPRTQPQEQEGRMIARRKAKEVEGMVKMDDEKKKGRSSELTKEIFFPNISVSPRSPFPPFLLPLSPPLHQSSPSSSLPSLPPVLMFPSPSMDWRRKKKKKKNARKSSKKKN